MTGKGRPKRVAEVLREEIATLLSKGLKDPRLGFVSVMSVNLSPDLHYANVHVSLYGDEKERKGSLVALQNASGWIRREIGRKIRLRHTPEIRFFPDDTLDRVYQLEEVFEKIRVEEHLAPMRALDLSGVLEELKGADSFLLTTHEHSDGDAVGSLLGLARLLRAMGKEHIHCVMADPPPRMYAFLPGIESIADAKAPVPDFDLAVIVDAGSISRIGNVADLIPSEKNLLIVDHHLDAGPQGAAGLIDPTYAATGEIVVELYQTAGLAMSRETAECLYVAQVTDTGGYRFSNTNARSHRIAASLVDIGVDTAAICSRVFDIMPVPKFHLLRRVLDRIELLADGRAAHSFIEEQDFVETESKREDLNNLVNYARNIEGVLVGVLFYHAGPGETKVSIRCVPEFDAAAFLRTFGGGGHAAAGGVTIPGELGTVKPRVLERLLERMKGLA